MTRQDEADKYKIAQDVFEEFKDARISNLTFGSWIKEKTKPKDPLLEKWHKLCHWVFEESDVHTIHDEKAFAKFKEIFKDELNGTKGLITVKEKMSELLRIKYFQKALPANIVILYEIVEKEIKERLEK